MAIIGEKDIEVFGQVGKILQENGGDVNPYYPPSYFTESAGLNMFAKYKPIRRNKPLDITEEDRKEERYGLSLPENDLKGVYQYLLPDGSANMLYRLGDFRGYYTDAPCFIRVDFPEHMYLNQWNTVNVWLDSRASDKFNDKTIGILDLFHDTDYYISLVVQGAEGRVVVLTNPTPIKTLCSENGQKLVTFNVGSADFTDMHTTAKFYVVANYSNSTDYNLSLIHISEPTRH